MHHLVLSAHESRGYPSAAGEHHSGQLNESRLGCPMMGMLISMNRIRIVHHILSNENRATADN
jgi:hypothetical protein